MKKLLIVFLILSGYLSFGQVTPVKSVKVTSSNIPFNENIPVGTIIIDTGTGQVYLSLIPLANTKTIALCTLPTEIKQITVKEVADEFTAAAPQIAFTLTQPPSVNSKVKMYINGVRISNTAYSNVGTLLTYVPLNNGSYTLVTGDRIQFDYFY
jgi:hypothetical protein